MGVGTGKGRGVMEVKAPVRRGLEWVLRKQGEGPVEVKA